MSAELLDGERVAEGLLEDLRARIDKMAAGGVTPGLGTILVGDDAPSANYVAMKHRDCEALGMRSFDTHLPADASQADLDAVVDTYNADPELDAFLIQYPIPDHLSYLDALLRVDPDKDVDGLHPVNLGKLVMGEHGPRPCTPAGIQALLAHYGIEVAGRHVVIVGRGITIGRALANLLTLKEPDANAAVTVLHTGVADLTPHLQSADIVVAAAGSPHMITADMLRPGVVAVGAGVTFEGRKVVSDLADDVAEVASWVTPRIGGVGPMTRAMLLSNTVRAAERRAA